MLDTKIVAPKKRQGRFYVYELAYPESMGGAVFYVGKGQDNRIDHHEAEARKGKRSYKCSVIRKIWAAGEQMVKRKVQKNMTEEAAYQLEKDLIRMYDRRHLTNLTDGGEGATGHSKLLSFVREGVKYFSVIDACCYLGISNVMLMDALHSKTLNAVYCVGHSDPYFTKKELDRLQTPDTDRNI